MRTVETILNLWVIVLLMIQVCRLAFRALLPWPKVQDVEVKQHPQTWTQDRNRRISDAMLAGVVFYATMSFIWGKF